MIDGRSPTGDLTANLWNAGLVAVDLPSGIRIRGVLPGIPELARHGLIPQDLRAAALHFADPAWMRAEGESPEEAAKRQLEWRRLVRLQVARFPQDIEVDGEWKPLGLTLEQRIERIGTPEHPGTMDTLDVDVLEDLVLRYRTPDQISRRSRVMRGYGSIEDITYVLPELRESLDSGRMGGEVAEYFTFLIGQLEAQLTEAGVTEAIEGKEALATVTDLATFRGDGRGAPNRATRRSRARGVAGAGVHAPRGRAARVPARRSADAP